MADLKNNQHLQAGLPVDAEFLWYLLVGHWGWRTIQCHVQTAANEFKNFVYFNGGRWLYQKNAGNDLSTTVLVWQHKHFLRAASEAASKTKPYNRTPKTAFDIWKPKPHRQPKTNPKTAPLKPHLIYKNSKCGFRGGVLGYSFWGPRRPKTDGIKNLTPKNWPNINVLI